MGYTASIIFLPYFMPVPRLVVRLPLSIILGMKWKEIYYFGGDIRFKLNANSILREMESNQKLNVLREQILRKIESL